MKTLKQIAGVAFALAFLMAIVLFTGYGRSFVPIPIAKKIFISSGAVGLLLNLLSFRTGKHHPLFNFVYWVGSIVMFVGLTFLLMRWPYGFYIVVTGLVILGISFFLPSNLLDQKQDDDLLDAN